MTNLNSKIPHTIISFCDIAHNAFYKENKRCSRGEKCNKLLNGQF